MPQENSSTHTPLFSSGFSQLYTQLPSHNRSRISMSAQKLSAQPVKPEAKSMIDLGPQSPPQVFFFFFYCDSRGETVISKCEYICSPSSLASSHFHVSFLLFIFCLLPLFQPTSPSLQCTAISFTALLHLAPCLSLSQCSQD